MIRFSPHLKTEELLSTFTICCWMSIHFLLDLFCCGIPLDWNNSGCCSPIWRNTNWWASKCNGLEYNGKLFEKKTPFTVARQIDYVFKQLWGKVILSGMHPIGQILNFDNWRQFQNRRAEHMHAPIHIVDAPKIDENEDSWGRWVYR